MKFVALYVSVCILVAINGELIIPPGTYSSTRYFDNVLDEVQGAMIDIVAAKSDLLVMEEKLQAITDESLMIFRTESIMENAVDSDAYENGWISNSYFIQIKKGSIILVKHQKYVLS